MKNKIYLACILIFSVLFFSCDPLFLLDDDDCSENTDDEPKMIQIEDFKVYVDKGACSRSELCTLVISGKLDSHFTDAKIKVRLFERTDYSHDWRAYCAFNLIDDKNDFVYSDMEFTNKIREDEYSDIKRNCEITFYDSGYYFLYVVVDADTTKKNSYVKPLRIEFPINIL